MRRYAAFVLALGALACGEEQAPKRSREELLDPLTCKECHAKYYDEWSSSMHAYASLDPVFRAMNARGQEETANAEEPLGPFCVKCHAPMAVQEGATTDGTNLDEVPDHLQGVTCYFCHDVKDVEGEHNNPLVLANGVEMRGGVKDPVESAAHHSSYSELHDGDQRRESSRFCGTCHDIVVPAHFSGAPAPVYLERTYDEWKRSIYDHEDSQPTSCAACHMRTQPRETIADAPGVLQRDRHAHTFDGVDRLPESSPHAHCQWRSVKAEVRRSMEVLICGNNIPGEFSVYVFNRRAGHGVPSGAGLDRRLWVELHAFDTVDGAEREIFTAGVLPASGRITDLEEGPTLDEHVEDDFGQPSPFLVRDRGFTASGEPAHMFWDVFRVEPSTVEPPAVVADPTPGAPVVTTDPPFVRHYKIAGAGFATARIAIRLRMQGIGADVLDDLRDSGHLSADHRDAPEHAPIDPFAPEDAPDGWALEWTRDVALAAKSHVPSPEANALCTSTAFRTIPVPEPAAPEECADRGGYSTQNRN